MMWVCVMKKYDEVKLIPKFENDIIYIVAEVIYTGIISLFPKSGGFLVSADVKNLIRI